MIETVDKVMTSNSSSVPEMVIPEWLESFLDSYNKPDILTAKDMIQLGKNLLNKKIADVEEYNMVARGGKKRIPEKIEFDEAAIIMMRLYKFRLIQLTNRIEDRMLAMYVADESSERYGTYTFDINDIYRQLALIAPKFDKREMDKVVDRIEISVPFVKRTTSAHLFPVNNGIYNKRTDELMTFDSSYVYTSKIPVDYNVNATNVQIQMHDGKMWDVEEWIADLMSYGKEETELIWQVINDCLQPNVSRNRSIWFYSEKGNNGKGTLGQLIKNLLGENNYSSLNVKQFGSEFGKEPLIDSMANIADENEVGLYIDTVSDYKASITGDSLMINRKNKAHINIQYRGANIQMMNGLPRTKDGSDSFYRRILLVPFLRNFTNNGEKPYIKSDFINRKEVLEYVLLKALSMTFSEFIPTQSSIDLMAEYKVSNNTVLDFWNEVKEELAWDLVPYTFLYDLYLGWLSKNSVSAKAMSSRELKKRLLTVIDEEGDNWTDTVTTKRTGNLMDADEPLITEYGLYVTAKNGTQSEWIDRSYGSTSYAKLRNFTRKDKYRGIVRI